MPKVELPEVDTNPFKMAAVGNLALLQALVEPPADEESTPTPLSVNVKDPLGCTPLAWAARNGYVEVVEYLAAHDGDLETESFGRMRPLHHAINHSRLPVVAKLLELGANPNAKDDVGNAPLHVAAARGIINPITLLVQAKANIDDVNAQGVTPLMKAVIGGHVTAVEKLIEYNADVDRMNSEGNAALHLAAKGGFAPIVAVLLTANSKMAVNRNLDNKTPVELAKDIDAMDIVKLLEKNG